MVNPLVAQYRATQAAALEAAQREAGIFIGNFSYPTHLEATRAPEGTPGRSTRRSSRLTSDSVQEVEEHAQPQSESEPKAEPQEATSEIDQKP